MAKPTLLLIDGNSLAFRSFYALINQVDRFVSHEGLHTNALVGFNNLLDGIVDPFKPDKALVAWDAGKTTFRTNSFGDYKGNRDKTPQELVEQFEPMKKMVELHGIKNYQLVDYEADDIIGTIAAAGDAAGYAVTIVTGDRDMRQLVTDNITVWLTKKGITEIDKYTPAQVAEVYGGLTPAQVVEVKGLQGDPSDNYPGVPGIGEKTAIKLIQEYHSIPTLYEHVDEMKASKRKENLITYRDDAFLSRELARIRTDAPLEINLDDLDYQGIHYQALIPFYQQLDFKQQLVKLANMGYVAADAKPVTQQPLKWVTLDFENEAELNRIEDVLDVYVELDGENYHRANIVGFVVGNAQVGYFASRNVDYLTQDSPVRKLLQNSMLKKRVFNAKALTVALARYGVQLTGVTFDLLLVSYLLNVNDNSNDLGQVAHEHQYFDVATDEEVYGKGAKFQIPVDDQVFFEHLGRKAQTIGQLEPALMQQLTDQQQASLYTEIELPLTFVLADMEMQGITVNADHLLAMQSKFSERLSELQQKIYQQAGHEFNIQSTKQLGTVLFEEMGLKSLKKTKTGYSTSVEVLEQMTDVPIVESILQYRQLSKIQSTYVDGLLRVIHGSDSKVHTRYLQTLTQTGRLSSVDPNLQNIPVRVEEGRQIRSAFVPSHEGWSIFSADYSQIELRVLAHVTGDMEMQKAFLADEDIHASTARRIFGIPLSDPISPNLRRQAKAVNFGIVYGISDFGLAKNIGTDRKTAKQIIETYLTEYSGVKAWTQKIIETAREQGYVETIAHRRRYLKDIKAKNFNLRSFAERTAMNTPIQGSAADIIKIAMIKMQTALKTHGLNSKMLLQVHDELIFEVPAEELATMHQLVPEIMDSAVQLDVPLKVETHEGKTWYDAK